MTEAEEYQEPEERLTDTGIVRVTRDEFLQDCWDYEPWQHVTILGPSQCGKTTLGYQLLDITATPQTPAIIFVMKPRDRTVTKWMKALDFRRTRTWPPTPSVFKARKPRGYVLWPRFVFDPERDNPELRRQFRRCILDSYQKGHRILFADETYSLSDELDLDEELVTVWTKGSSMDCSMWAASQRPSHIPLWAYSMATHLFIARDPDRRARQRYGEISGVDPKLVDMTVMQLARHEFLYIRQYDGSMCIVEK